jgi:Fe-S cluster assembly ATPase SufC
MTATTVAITLPEGVLTVMQRLAEAEGMTLEQFLATAAREKLDAMIDPAAYFAARAARAKPGALAALLSREGGEPPRPGDEIA